MGVSAGKGEQWVVISAIMVLGIYAYRRLTEAASGPFTIGKALGQGNPLPVASFITAWGFVFLVISLMQSADDRLGGTFAVLVMTSDFLANAPALFDRSGQLAKTVPPSHGVTPAGTPGAHANVTAGLGG